MKGELKNFRERFLGKKTAKTKVDSLLMVRIGKAIGRRWWKLCIISNHLLGLKGIVHIKWENRI